MNILPLNGIQHFSFCPRQWALITIEQVWEENEDTALGHLVHSIADDSYYEEVRGNRIITRAVPIQSLELGFTGVIDVLEYHRMKDGIRLKKHPGNWMPFIIEFKKGREKKDLCDVMQLTAQVMCLEESMKISIKQSALYYKSTNSRVDVEISDELRNEVRLTSQRMHDLYESGITPPAIEGKHCGKCSLKDLCWPRITTRKRSVDSYIDRAWEGIDAKTP